MKIVKIANKEYIFVEVPDNIVDVTLSTNNTFICDRSNGGIKTIEIGGDENFKIITTTNSITEEVAKSLIPNKQTLSGIIYPHYPLLIDTSGYYNEKHWASICVTALESFYSLMDSLELDRSKNYLLIEKLKQ